MSQQFILKDISDRVMVITMNRPEALNALCRDLVAQLNQALSEAENNPNIGAIVLMGNEKAFAAGADLREIKDLTIKDVAKDDFITSWEYVATCRKPVIAAVSGYALGGGCELAMMCDIILASDSAHFGQPEITLGTMPGCGGTQRLTRLVGKTRAMEMCLTGRLIDVWEAQEIGLVTRVVPLDQLRAEAVKLAQKIASFSQPVVQMIKESIQSADHIPLSEGIQLERRLFHSTFDLKDRQEGMAAFLEKRKPVFKHE
jgi:enoyl-CoA hydratase